MRFALYLIRHLEVLLHSKSSGKHYLSTFVDTDVILNGKVVRILFGSILKNGNVETVPRHREISDQLSRKICKGLEIAVIGRNE